MQAVGLDYCEIAWVRKVRGKRKTTFSLGEGNTPSTEYLTFLEFGLQDSDTSILKEHLDAERKLKVSQTYLGWIAVKSICHDFPLEVEPGGIIRLRWRGIIDYFLPSGRLIQVLSKFVKVEEEIKNQDDLSYNRKGSLADQEAKILKLLKSGDKIKAIELTRQVYGCSLTDAVKYVEESANKIS